MKRPRLLIAVTSPMSAVFFHGQLAWLRDQGFDVHFACGAGQSAQEIATGQGAMFHPLHFERSISPWSDLRALWQVINLLRRVRPHIVNAGTPKAGLLMMLAAWLCRIPVRIYTVHGLRFETVRDPLRSVLTTIERLVCACATRVLCVGPGLRGLVLSHQLCPAAKLTVPAHGSANGIDLEAFQRATWSAAAKYLRQELAIPQDAPVIGFVGRLVRDKGIAELVQAWRQVREKFPAVHLLIVGDVEAGDPIGTDDLNALRDDERVHITGFITEVRPAYAVMQVLVLPTYREGLPTVLLEAGAMSLPAVASDIPGCRDVVISDITGLLVPPRDAIALGAALSHYMRDQQACTRDGFAARSVIVRRFSRQVVWQGLAACYRDAMADTAAE